MPHFPKVLAATTGAEEQPNALANSRFPDQGDSRFSTNSCNRR
jgi:hypothetical protein